MYVKVIDFNTVKSRPEWTVTLVYLSITFEVFEESILSKTKDFSRNKELSLVEGYAKEISRYSDSGAFKYS